METSLPANILQELSRALGEMGDGAAFAVRSSGLGEDSETNSFAGLMDSFVNVPTDEVPRRVREVWASAFSARALFYRHRKGISLAGVSAAVIHMITTEVRPLFNFRRSRPGHRYRVALDSDGNLVDFRYSTSVTESVYLFWDVDHYVARRGMINLSLPMTEKEFAGLEAAFDAFLEERAALLEQI